MVTNEEIKKAQMAITRLRVGALEDITCDELEAFLHYLDDLIETQQRYWNVMETLSVDYEDMFPEDTDD